MEYSIDLNKIFVEDGKIQKIYLNNNGKYRFFIRENSDDKEFLEAAVVVIGLMVKKDINMVLDMCLNIQDEKDLELIRGLCKNISFPKLKEENEVLTGVYPLKNDGFNFVILNNNNIKMLCTNGYKYTPRESKEFLSVFKVTMESIMHYNYEGFLQIYSSTKYDEEAFKELSSLYINYEENLENLGKSK